MHEYPNEYTQIQHGYDKLNTQIEEDINLQEYPKIIPKELEVEIQIPKIKIWSTMTIIFRDYTQNL